MITIPNTGFTISLRATLITAIVMMGVLAVSLALMTGGLYRDLAFANQRDALARLVNLKSQDLLHVLAERTRSLGLGTAQASGFDEALQRRDAAALTALLNNQFHQYFVTARVLHLSRLYLFDTDLALIAASSEGDAALRGVDRVCPAQLAMAGQRSGADRLKPVSALCVMEGRPFHSTLVAVGGLRVKGYIQVVTDPVYTLQALEAELRMPVQLRLPDAAVAYASTNWPDQMRDVLVAEDVLHTASGEPVVSIAMASSMDELMVRLADTRRKVIISAAFATLLLALLVMALLRKLAVQPLRNLTRHLRRVREDKTELSKAVEVTGNTEVRELAKDFNEMTHELHDLYQRLESMAYTDALTSLPNRVLLMDRLEQCIAINQRQKGVFALMVMDLDRFKEVNDTLGHECGDRLLKEVSARLTAALRQSDTLSRLSEDTVARLGGDEFAALLPTTANSEGAITVAQRIVRLVTRPVEMGQHSFNVGISIGIAIFPRDGEDAATLMRHADIAMYQAKRSQRGYAIYDPEQDDSSIGNLVLGGQLREAIENDKLDLHYQPKIDLRSGRICGVEALARWTHPELGAVPPDVFVNTAERVGLIQPFTEWVVHRALSQVASWQRDGLPIDLSLNMSALNLHDPSLPDQLEYALKHWKVHPWFLRLELTESAVMTDPQRALDIMNVLTGMGLHIAVDDFGTGYSSLAYLKRLPVNEIKIDRSFVMDMMKNPQDAVIVRSTIDLAHNMSLRVVAEGIEDEATLRELIRLKCDFGQGYHMSRPVPAAALIEWLAKSPWALARR